MQPFYDRIIIKREEKKETSPGGIVLPDEAIEEPARGEVVAVGNGRIAGDGSLMPLEIKAGDKVIFGKYAGIEVKENDETFLIMKEEDILARI